MTPITRHLSQVSEAMTLLDHDEVEQVIAALKVIRKARGTVYLFGNGGSHSTASHFANDLLKMAKVKAVCIGDMTPAILAYGNDVNWDNMFRMPLFELLNPNDGVVGISCSGNSENVLSALGHAKVKNNLTIGMTGQSDESKINRLGLEALVHVRADDIRVQEDVHLMVCHAVVRALQEKE